MTIEEKLNSLSKRNNLLTKQIKVISQTKEELISKVISEIQSKKQLEERNKVLEKENQELRSQSRLQTTSLKESESTLLKYLDLTEEQPIQISSRYGN